MAFGQAVFTQGLDDATDKSEWQHHWYVENGNGARMHMGSNAAGPAFTLGERACPRGNTPGRTKTFWDVVFQCQTFEIPNVRI